MFRTTLFWITLIFGTIFFFPLVLFSAFFRSRKALIHRLQQLWARLQLWSSGVTFEVTGLENIRPDQTYIVMANHQSYHDIFLLATLPMYIHWMAKKELFKIPVFGWILRLMEAIRIDRESRSLSSLKQAVRQIRAGATVLVFPEGTRSSTGELLPLKDGPFTLAIRTQKPILPITIQGTRRIMPKGSVRIHSGRVKMTIGPAIETELLTLRDRECLRDQIEAVFLQELRGGKCQALRMVP